ncbi:acetate--CoA ligase family protein [Nakamurella endophytica]|uniref:CoA-binding protein n=1 Tax=Nakamurella endophytica TaxID=1748367 RepID=A0A917WDB6_9ACTN|nr:acetate--CoA ligase family protein [Nakamurella endophytica]GGL94691.1 CoA-binding protein [Nakamurella endophytica]
MSPTARGVAVVGASENGIPWTEWLLGSLAKHGHTGPVWMVNPRRAAVHGRATVPDVASLPGVPEVAAVMTGADVAVAQIEQLVDLGCRRIMVVSNGFAELGTADGRRREDRLRALCAGRDVLLVGPNCVGFAFFHEQLCAISQPVPHGLVAGDVSIASQSGGLTGATLGAVHRQGLGVDAAFSLGNGAVFGITEALEALVARPTTSVVLGVVESIRDRAGVERAAAAARDSGKTIALLLLGASAGGRQVAQSHTGAIVGQQRLTAAWLHSLGVVTVGGVEELGRVAALGRLLGPGGSAGAFVATVSGGGAGLTADLAARHRVPMAEPAPGTVDRLRAALPAGGYVGNPIDISTGDAAAVYDALGDDPGVRYLIEPWALPWPTESPEYHWQRAAMGRLADMSERTGMPVLVSSLFSQPVSPWMAAFAEGTGLEVSADLELTLAALGRLSPGRPLDGDLVPAGGATDAAGAGHSSAVVTEAQARQLLAAAGVPVVRGAEGADVEAVVALSAGLTAPFAVKVSTDTVGHKERIGGVVLGVPDADGVRDACRQIRTNAVAAGVDPGAVRFLVTEMVSGSELLVGVQRDPVAGPCLTVAVGGWAAEAGAVFGTVPLPADWTELSRRLDVWGLRRLLGEDRAAGLLTVLEAVATAATGPLSAYREIEINPVMLTSRGPVVVDALLTR